MIDVELLPSEFRRRERTPTGVFAAVLGGVVLAATSAAYAVHVHFGVYAGVEAERQALEEERAVLAKGASVHDALVAEKVEFEERIQQLRDISATRIPWARKLDELGDIVNRAEEDGRYLVWFEDLAIEQQTEARGGGGKVELNGYSGSANFTGVSSFFEDLDRPAFAAGFLDSLNIPSGKPLEPDPERIPSEVWEFQVRIQLPKVEPKKPATPPRRPSPSAAPAGK